MPLPIVREELSNEDYRAFLWLGRNKGDGTLRHHKLFQDATGQWHLEKVCDDGEYHHLYCDLTIKKPDSPHLKALLELLAMASISKLDGHFEQIFKYEEQLQSREIWIVHFSRKDFIVPNPYWPCEKLQ